MEIKGKVLQKLPIEQGTGKNGKDWKKQFVIIETQETYPKKICLCFWGDKIDLISNVYVGAILTAHINIESREFNGKWFTEVQCWKLEMEASQSPKMEQAAASSDFITDLGDEQFEDDIPF